jgi:hypothetical protein
MWLKHLTIAAAFSCWLLPSSAQVIANQAPVPATVVVASQTNLLLFHPQPGNNGFLGTNLYTGLAAPALSLNRTSPKLPMPGIYKTEPYACIVLVPESQADDRSVVKPTDRGSAMPVIKPELRFIPMPGK